MPSKKESERLTPLETEIMNVLWEISPATVQTVQQQRLRWELAYTTVQMTPEKLARLQRMLKAREARDE